MPDVVRRNNEKSKTKQATSLKVFHYTFSVLKSAATKINDLRHAVADPSPTHCSSWAKAKPSGSLKVSIRGKDDAPLSMQDLRQGLYELAQKLESYAQQYRAKRAALYLTIVDENGAEVRLSKTGELTIYPYPSAADRLETSLFLTVWQAMETTSLTAVLSITSMVRK
jgi:hypothetical protein